MSKYTLRDETSETEIDAATDAAAREAAKAWAREGTWDTDGGTVWVYVAIERDGEHVDTVTVPIDPPEPRCEDERGHDWRSPLELVGGLEENPGVWGHGGGVIIREVCMRYGCAQATDTWATDRSTGRQGLVSLAYEPGIHADAVRSSEVAS